MLPAKVAKPSGWVFDVLPRQPLWIAAIPEPTRRICSDPAAYDLLRPSFTGLPWAARHCLLQRHGRTCKQTQQIAWDAEMELKLELFTGYRVFAKPRVLHAVKLSGRCETGIISCHAGADGAGLSLAASRTVEGYLGNP